MSADVARVAPPAPDPADATVDQVIAALEAGRLRAAAPDSEAPDGWEFHPEAFAALDRETERRRMIESFDVLNVPKDIQGLIREALVKPVERRPTRPRRGAVRRRLEDKRKTGERKQARGRVETGA